MPKIFVSTVPFGEFDSKPRDLLNNTGWDYTINPLNRKLTPEEVGEFAQDCDGLIAGTEDIHTVLKKAKNLKIISRVGIGLDSVSLAECKKRGIVVTYTPDAVTMAVAELTIGLMINATRFVLAADRNTREGMWHRLQGKRLGKSVVGLIGFGRIGFNVARLLSEFQPAEILINDLKDKTRQIEQLKSEKSLCIRQVEKEEIFRGADVVSLHIPFSSNTKGIISKKTLDKCSPDTFLINTARGGVVNEIDLFEALKKGRIGGAAIDVFEREPYRGPLTELKNVVLTQHMGSCSFDCRSQMETQVTEDIIRFFQGKPTLNEVPEEEYSYQEPGVLS